MKSLCRYKAIYRSRIAKCKCWSTRASWSTLASEQMEEVSHRKLTVPTSTRWYSLYEAISRVIMIPMNDLNPLCVKIVIKCLNEREYLFLQEYCTVMKPLTVALDILQGDECTYGALRTTSLTSKTLALKNNPFPQQISGVKNLVVNQRRVKVLNLWGLIITSNSVLCWGILIVRVIFRVRAVGVEEHILTPLLEFIFNWCSMTSPENSKL